MLQLVVTPSNPTVAEGGTVMLSVTATGCDIPFADVTYTVTVEPITATAPDFGAPSPMSFQFGFVGGFNQMVMVPTVQDALDEVDETFRVRFTPTPGELLECKIQGIVTPTEASTVVTIADDDLPPALSIDDVLVAEGNAGTVTALFTATLSAPSGQTVSVGFATADGTASAGKDYQAATGTLSFAPGTTTQTVGITVNGDTDLEPDETYFVNLSSPSGATLADAQGLGTIENDDEPGASALAIGDVLVLEGDAGTRTAQFTVTLSPASSEPVGVGFATADGSATAGTDYQAATGTLSFTPGATTRTVAVTVNGDTEVEPDETFFVNLSNPTGATVMDGQGQGTIQNDDEAAPGTLSIDDVTVVEGDAGTVEARFTVTLSTASQEPVGVDFATADGTAAAGTDYQAATGTLSFAPGATTRTIAVTVNGDTAVESDETFFVNLSNPTGATVADGQGQGTIQNDDEAAPGTLSIDDVTVVEGDAGTVEARFTVTLSTVSQEPVGVDFATADGTAAAGTDYQAAQGTLSFAPGATTRTIAVLVNGDTAVEPDETFFVNLSNPTGATLADGQGQGTIQDDDDAVPLTLSIDDVTVIEGDTGTAAIFTVSLSGPSERREFVDFATADGTAMAGTDYEEQHGPVTFQPGETFKTIPVSVFGDTAVEPDETFFVNLSNGSVTVTDAQGRGLIRNDDEEPEREITRDSDAESSAGPGQLITVRVRVTQRGRPAPGIVVTWSVEGDAELVGGDSSVSQAPDGIASKQVRLGENAGQVTVTAHVPGAEEPVSFAIVNQGPLEELFTGDETGGSVAGALDGACRGADGDLREFCDYLFGLDDAGVRRQAIDALIPTQVATQGTVANQSMAIQVGHLLDRMKTVRKAARSQGGGRLALNLQLLGVDAGRVRQALARYRQDRGLLERHLDAALASADPRRTALALDAQDGPSGEEPAEEVSFSRWGFFLSGSVESGDRPDSQQERGFSFDTQGLTAGLDYGLSDRWTLGAALGYLSTDTEFSGPGGGLDVEGFSLSAFATYSRQAFYVEAVASYGNNEYQQARAIELPVPFGGQSRFVAVGEPDGDQLGLALGLGHDFAVGAASIGAFGRLSYLESAIDGYRERGAGPLTLEIDRQELESLIAEVGVEATYAASLSWGVLLPQLRVGFLRELEDDSRLLRGRFVEDRGFNEFVVPTEAPDRDFFNVGAGLTATLARGRTFFLFVDKDFSRDDLDATRVSGGFRLEL